MSKRFASFLRGMGSVLEIAPHPQRRVRAPLYRFRKEPPEHALYRTWERVGDDLIAASGYVGLGEGRSSSVEA